MFKNKSEERFISSFFPGESGFLILDLRQTSIELKGFYRRFWSSQGYLLQELPLADNSLALIEPLVRWKNILVIQNEGDDAPPEIMLLILEHAQAPEWVKVKDHTWIYKNAPLNPQPQIESAGLIFKIQGETESVLTNCILPYTFRISVPECTSLRYLRVSPEAPPNFRSKHALPQAVWFKLPESKTYELEVAIQPDVNPTQDVLQVRSVTTDEILMQIPDGPPGYTPLALYRRMALVLDRTCPDQDKWDQAFRHSLKLGRLQETSELPPENPNVEENIDLKNIGKKTTQSLPTDSSIASAMATLGKDKLDEKALNQDIRTAIAQSFQAYFASFDSDIEIDTYWFSDWVPGKKQYGVGEGECGRFKSNELDKALQECTYYPGFDLWDPLEKSLKKAYEKYLNESPRTLLPMLIIGNSPPNPPADSSFIYQLVNGNAHFSVRSTLRQQYTPDFETVTQAYRQEGIPLVYLFLKHHETHNPQMQEDLLRYRAVYNIVEDCLSDYLTVVTCEANFEGIHAGVKAALDILTQQLESGVRLLS